MWLPKGWPLSAEEDVTVKWKETQALGLRKKYITKEIKIIILTLTLNHSNGMIYTTDGQAYDNGTVGIHF